MTPFLPIGLGVVAIVAGVAVLLSFGRRFRVGRLLASIPRVSIAEAVRIAGSGEPRYVRIDGRIDSDREFEDADHRPLVLRLTRVEVRDRRPIGGWRVVETSVEAVPFQLQEGLDVIDVDEDALSDGLVVVPRRSAGVAGDLRDRIPAEVPSATPARVTIQQISSVEHAIALGRPTLDASGRARLTAGLGRPLVLTTIEIPEAMRILTGGAVLRARVAAACLVAGAALLLGGGIWWLALSIANPAAALAASPGSSAATSPGPSILPGADTRSAGQGPGLVGDPALAVLGVLAVGLLAVGMTLLYVRLTSGRDRA